MQVSVETVDGLKRKLMISVPHQDIEEEVSIRIRNLARKVKLDGFRPGHAPLKTVTDRYSASVREEVVRDLIQPTLTAAIKQENLHPAGMYPVEPQPLLKNTDFNYSVVIEVFPTIHLVDLQDKEVIQTEAEITDADVDYLLNKLREQNKDWVEVTKPVASGDKVIINFKGFIDGKPFEGGEAEDFNLEIGSGSMIPGFETGIIGKEINQPFELDLAFPEDYQHKPLAGQQTTFQITITQILEGKLPEINDDLAKKFGIKEGGIEALKKDIKENMSRELERRLSALNKENIFEAFAAMHDFDVPELLVEQEIDHLKHEMYHQIFGSKHVEGEKIPDFPKELFLDKAKHRVKLGLLLAEYIKVSNLIVNQAVVDAKIDKLAAAYEDPQELKAWYANPERRGELEALVLEEMAADRILEKGRVIKNQSTYNEIMNPSQKNSKEGASE